MALALGMTLGELRERMSSAELTGWYAYNAIEPIGDQRADLRMALQMRQDAAIASMGKRQYKVEDFMPFKHKPPQQDLTPEQMMAKWKKALGKD